MKCVTLKKDGKEIENYRWYTIAQARDYARETLNGADIYVNGEFWESVNGCRRIKTPTETHEKGIFSGLSEKIG